MINIADNIKRIRDAIAEAALKTGRSPQDITLVAASKTQPADAIRQAIAAGVDAVGENRVRELLDKKTQGAYIGKPLHYIGNLQSNKVRQLVGACDLIETVSTPALVEMIGQRAVSRGTIQEVLIEVNIGAEPQKSGILPQQTEELLAQAAQTEGISVLGLMAIPPKNGKNEPASRYFDLMFHLFVDMSGKKYDNVPMRFLSMGMSDSYIDAILAGSNMVRIGTAIFGER